MQQNVQESVCHYSSGSRNYGTASICDSSQFSDQEYVKVSSSLLSVASALYCKILVVLGLAFPMAEAISDKVPEGYYQLFNIYLYCGSLCFLCIVYANQIGQACIDHRDRRASAHMDRRQQQTQDGFHHKPYGSFYLRLGTVVFGIGSMIMSGIEAGMIAEVYYSTSVPKHCRQITYILRPILNIIFVFVQMYFIFQNHKVSIYQRKVFARFGLMHLIATNLTSWLYTLIQEAKHSIDHHRQQSQHLLLNHFASEKLLHEVSPRNGSDLGQALSHQALRSDQCEWEHTMLHSLLHEAGPFLYPCTIEYSLICGAVLFVMWKNVDKEHFHRRQLLPGKSSNYAYKRKQKKSSRAGFHDNISSLDCSNTNSGFFSGIFLLVLTVISLIFFFVLMASQREDMKSFAILVATSTELSLYSIATITVLVCMHQIQRLWYDASRKIDVDNLLLIVAQSGVFIHSAFCMIGSFFQWEDHYLSFFASFMALLQTTLQTVFILDAVHSQELFKVIKTPKKVSLTRDVYGRELITFLLICNLAMWSINTLESNRSDSHPVQLEFYGEEWAWPIINHISMPLAIFYRFHSTVCLFEIWKRAFHVSPKYIEEP